MSKRSTRPSANSPAALTPSKHNLVGRSLLKVLTVLLINGGLFSLVLPLLAQTTLPGTEIRNQATGSYEDPDDMGNVQEVLSNEVVVKVSEVAGITLTATASPAEAPNSINSSNANQGNGTITADDVVYFTFTLTNAGNDPTQFVIPDSPSSIINGTLFGPIELIEYDPDGSGTSPVSLNNITVPLGGGGVPTGTLLASVAGANNGSVPSEGTLTIRVPVQVDSAAVNGDQMTVVMGETSPTGAQNEPLSQGADDVATQDNPGADNGDADGAPANGEREASTSQILSIGGDNDGDGIPDGEEGSGDRDGDGIPDDEDFDPQGYFYDEETGQILSGGSISITPPPGGSVNLIDDGSATGNYQWIASGAAGIYTTIITPPPGYIISPTCVESTPAYDPTGNPNPDSLGASENGNTGQLTSNLCGDNPYYIDFDLAPGDPLIINNNYPFIPDPGRDYGDAPDTYGTNAADTGGEGVGASHVIVPGLQLGTAPDFEADAQAPLDGTGDGAEDDGIVLAPLNESDTAYTIAATDITATNTTGTAATLHAWVDFDGSGIFEADEYASQTVQSGNSNPDGALAWSGAGLSGMTGGTTTYARFRLTTYGLTDDTGTAALDERAIGPVTSGEVEDYAVAIAPSPAPPPSAPANACELLLINDSFEDPRITMQPPNPNESFGSPPVVFIYNESDIPGWLSSADDFIEIWDENNNATATGIPPVPIFEGNQFAEINAYVNGSLYQDLTTTPGTVLTWQFAHRGRTGVDTLNLKIGPPGATVAQINPTTGTTSFTTDNSNWVVYQGTYTVPPGQTTTQFEFVAVSTASGDQAEGNFLDAIKFGPLCDHGDADASYPVERTNGGAAHTRDGATYLGNQVFAEIAANPSTAADGDDNATGDGDFQDDEDGVTFTSPLAAGSTATVDVVASVAAPLSAWIDFNNNGSWDDPGEQIFADEPLTAGANSLSFTIPVGATVGNTYARFRISSQSGLAPTGIVGGGEVEDYRVVIQPMASNPNVVLVKRITAINGDRTQNPNDNTPLNAVANDGTANSPDDELNWPPNYLLGETNAGLVLPGDQIEYTVYYLNARADAAEQVRICDWIQANQSVVPGLYNGNDVELQIGEGTGSITYELTLANDPGDRAQIATVDALPAGPTCNLPATSAGTTDDVLVIDLTGTTGDPSVLTTTLPGSTAPGTPDEAFGFFRFTTKVDE